MLGNKKMSTIMWETGLRSYGSVGSTMKKVSMKNRERGAKKD